MPEKQHQEQKKEINCEVNLQFIEKVRKNISIDPISHSIVIMPRNDDTSVFTTTEEENILLSFSA